MFASFRHGVLQLSIGLPFTLSLVVYFDVNVKANMTKTASPEP